FSLSRPERWLRPDAAETGAVGVDLGWCKLPDGSMRVAHWEGSDGASGQLTISADELGPWQKTRDLQEIRDRHRDACKETMLAWRHLVLGSKGKKARASALSELRQTLLAWAEKRSDGVSAERLEVALHAWLKALDGDDTTAAPPWPAWMVKEAEHLAHWHAHRKFARLVRRWRQTEVNKAKGWINHRFANDTFAFDVMEAWRAHDKHLYDWQSFNRGRSLRWRDDLYRKFAARLQRSYAKVAFSDTSFAELRRRPKTEDDRT